LNYDGPCRCAPASAPRTTPSRPPFYEKARTLAPDHFAAHHYLTHAYESHVADAVAKGARVLLGAKRHPRGGRFFEPTILTGGDTVDGHGERRDIRAGRPPVSFRDRG
jgi:hypothetical protein